MKFLTCAKRKVLAGCIAGLLACSFVLVPVSQTLTIAKVHAQMAVAEQGPVAEYNLLTSLKTAAIYLKEAASTAYNFITSGATFGIFTKEITLDGIAWQLVNIAIKEMITSTTRWVNSGFQGSPAFVTDLNGYLTRIADDVAGDFIWGAGLGFVCSPFQLNIRSALDLQYRAPSRFQTQCRLSDVVNNFENFFEGNSMQGGWDSWYAMTLTPENNPYGAFINAQAALDVSIQNARGEKIELLKWGDGFLSKEKCDTVAEGPPHCRMVTPGSVIQNQINRTLGLSYDRIVVADEINELVGALMTQLVNQALSGAGGLLGLSDTNGGRGDYFDRMQAETDSIGYNNNGGTGANGALNTQAFDDTIETEADYLRVSRSLVARLEKARLYKNTTYGTTTVCASSTTLTPSLNSKLTTAKTRVADSTEVLADIRALRADALILQNPATSEATLRTLFTKYSATNISQAQANLMREFGMLRSGGVLHSPAETNRIEFEVIPDTRTEISTYMRTVDDSCRNVPVITATTTDDGT